MIVQIYAFTEAQEALRAFDLGVDHIGFVAGQYGIVHGELSFGKARSIADALPDGARSCALTMATEVDEILRMAEVVRPDIIHVSTDPMDVPPATMADLRRRLPPRTKVMKAIPVEGDGSLELASSFAGHVDFLLLDSKAASLPGVGATGQTHDWNLSRRIVEYVSVPSILAGGLSPENVAEAVRRVRPWGVDSNTATNLHGDPVEKNMDRVAAFVKAARSVKRED